jgi:hypothetical protein
LRNYANLLVKNSPNAQTNNQPATTLAHAAAPVMPPSALKNADSDSQSKFNSKILSKKETIALNAILVLCNLSDQFEIKQALSQINDLSAVLIKLLEFSNNEDMQSRVAILLADVATVDEKNKISFVEQGCLNKLLLLLDSEVEDLLINTVNAIEVLCKDNVKYQNYCCEHGVMEGFINLLELNSGKYICIYILGMELSSLKNNKLNNVFIIRIENLTIIFNLS